LESEGTAGQRYIGVTSDLRKRLFEHNNGKSSHTSKFLPWRLVTYIAFSNERKAETFERYLKSGSGHAFARKRLW
jgi:predicted GIY-YIG superfamily endonuclease